MGIKNLYIAEKKSVGEAIAQNLGGSVNAVKGSSGRITHYLVGDSAVTWGYGHILELFEPEDYNNAFKGGWRDAAGLLPLIPQPWQLKPISSTKDQLAVIKRLLKEVNGHVVHAGDPDREGQLLIDEVLDYLGNKQPVKRILPNAIDDKSMQRILAAVEDNAKYAGLYKAGLGRQRADWLVGMNMSRACTISNERGGMSGVLSVGRVQTPTLALIVKRDLEIENFKPQSYVDIEAEFQHAKGRYMGKWVCPKGLAGTDSEGRIVSMDLAAKIKRDCDAMTAHIAEYKVEDREQSPPLLYSLSSLQKKASELYRMSAKQVLEICQSLYEKKVCTYPRTDCQYLPEDQFAEAASVIKAVAAFDADLAGLVPGANSQLKSAVWNSKKVTAHHAIVPTGLASFGTLSEPERKIFGLVAKQFLAQFYPKFLYKQTSITTRCSSHDFKSNGRVTIDSGWKRVFAREEELKTKSKSKSDVDDEKADVDQQLPLMSAADTVTCSRLLALKKLTKAPSRFTEGTLIHAMTNVHETVSDPEIKKKLQEVKGIGTEATRGDVIDTLKKRGFVSDTLERGCIVSTPAGRSLISALPRDLTDVTLTALWENALDQIERGVMPLDRFIDGQTQWIKKLTKQALESNICVPVGLITDAAVKSATGTAGSACPECGTGVMRVRQAMSGPNKGNYFLSCSNYPDCKHTQDIDGQDEPKGKGGGRKRGGEKRGS